MSRAFWNEAQKRRIEATMADIESLEKEYGRLVDSIGDIESALRALDDRLRDLQAETYDECLGDYLYDQQKDKELEEKYR